MIFGLAEETDLERIMNIIGQVQRSFSEQGINQWQNGYPNPAIIRNDINCRSSYAIYDDGDLLATAAVSFSDQESYYDIREGAWRGDNKYGAIHRVAVDPSVRNRGLATHLMHSIEDLCQSRKMHSVRSSTHSNNTAMQSLLAKCGFEACGLVCLSDGSYRIAFDKLL